MENTMKFQLLFVSIFSLLAGCQFQAPLAPGQEMLNGRPEMAILTVDEVKDHIHDLGQPPTSYRENIKTIKDAELKDPYSAHYTFHDPVPGKVFHDINPYDYTRGGHYEYGWLCFFEVNAKNSYGGYAGNEQGFWVFRGNTVIAYGAMAPGIGPAVIFASDPR